MPEVTMFCDTCDGNGIVEAKCRLCDEDGIEEMIQCEDCEGSGRIEGVPSRECDSCKGQSRIKASICTECGGSRRIEVDSSRECDSCNGDGFLKKVMCTRDECNDGYIESECHEMEPHQWTLYKCSFCDYSSDGREGDEVAANALYQHEYEHKDD